MSASCFAAFTVLPRLVNPSGDSRDGGTHLAPRASRVGTMLIFMTEIAAM